MKNKGDMIILLHGFPETSYMWIPLIHALADQGYCVVAPDQRGYSINARPKQTKEYHIHKLANDVFQIADAFNCKQFHLVGHDWGASIGWTMLGLHPDRILSWTSLSIPHLLAFQKAYFHDKDQRKRSRYIALFKLPWLAEKLFSIKQYKQLKKIWHNHTSDQIQAYMQTFSQPGALTASLNWYRANLNRRGLSYLTTQQGLHKIITPTQLIWGAHDIAVGRKGIELTQQYMRGPYNLIELQAGHWLIQEKEKEVVSLILNFINTYQHKTSSS